MSSEAGAQKPNACSGVLVGVIWEHHGLVCQLGENGFSCAAARLHGEDDRFFPCLLVNAPTVLAFLECVLHNFIQLYMRARAVSRSGCLVLSVLAAIGFIDVCQRVTGVSACLGDEANPRHVVLPSGDPFAGESVLPSALQVAFLCACICGQFFHPFDGRHIDW